MEGEYSDGPVLKCLKRVYLIGHSYLLPHVGSRDVQNLGRWILILRD